MQLPALLPQKFIYCKSAETDVDLYNLLIKQSADFVQFFTYACDDETWSDLNAEMMRKMIDYLTDLSFQNKLDASLALQAAQAIQKHYSNLRELIKKNIIIQLDDVNIPINSLVLGGVSPFFQDLIRRQCFEKKHLVISLKGVLYNPIFKVIEEFIYTGDVRDIWKLEQDVLLKIMRQAMAFELKELSEMCEKVLVRYINPQNAFEMLTLSIEESLIYLRNASLEFLNTEQKGLKITSYGIDSLGCTFYDFNEETLEVFEKIQSKIRHIQSSDTLTEDPTFAKIMGQCKKLESLDVGHTRHYSDYLLSLPTSLQILNISACAWLTNAHLKKVLDVTPRLNKIFMGSNTQLTTQGWSELQKLRGLKHLDISRSPQITNEDLRIILHACLNLSELNVEDCRQLTDKGFLEIIKIIPRITFLNAARTNISDEILSELAAKAQGLHSLNLTRCEYVTEKGIIDCVRQAFDWKELELTECHISQKGLDEIAKIRPFLNLKV
jgi:hypothetical protein